MMDIPLRPFCLKPLLALIVCTQSALLGYSADRIALRFLEDPSVDGNVVRLGDLVEIVSGKSESLEKLLALSLSPAPLENASQSWHSSDIIQHLSLRGIHPLSIRWVGATQVQLKKIKHVDASQLKMAPAFLQERAFQQAMDNVGRAISEYLSLQVGEAVQWQVTAQVPGQHVRTLQSRRNIVSIGGGEAPWTGKQEFVLQIKHLRDEVRINVTAEVELPPMVLAATRPLRRDQILTAEDLTFTPLSQQAADRQAGSSGVSYFSDLDELIGKQLRRAVSTGVIVQSDYVGEPMLVSRNSLVEIQSVAGGITVSTQGKALGSGAKGELVQVELLSNKQKLYATVVDNLTVRIAAQAKRTSR